MLFAGSFIVLGLYVYLYRALNKTLNELAKFVTELQSPKQKVRVSEVKQVEKEKQAELEVQNSKRLLDSFNQRDLQVLDRGKMLRTYSSRMFKRSFLQADSLNVNPNQKKEEDLESTTTVTIELPWQSIKSRFHIFFTVSIFFLLFSIGLFIGVRLVSYPPNY